MSNMANKYQAATREELLQLNSILLRRLDRYWLLVMHIVSPIFYLATAILVFYIPRPPSLGLCKIVFLEFLLT